MNDDKVLRLIGLCRKSGKCSCGASAVEYAIKRFKSKLLIVASDCGESTKKKFLKFAEENSAKYVIMFDKYTLGDALGYKELSLLSVDDVNFADGICKCVEDMEVRLNGENEN